MSRFHFCTKIARYTRKLWISHCWPSRATSAACTVAEFLEKCTVHHSCQTSWCLKAFMPIKPVSQSFQSSSWLTSEICMVAVMVCTGLSSFATAQSSITPKVYLFRPGFKHIKGFLPESLWRAPTWRVSTQWAGKRSTYKLATMNSSLTVIRYMPKYTNI
jgi:hypothetical protein